MRLVAEMRQSMGHPLTQLACQGIACGMKDRRMPRIVANQQDAVDARVGCDGYEGGSLVNLCGIIDD